ncbi:P-loop containing nucleoside triphosphate hydrolase protein [Mycena rebaudengoi]|nr:P-loop containing nucleoside triphosphate hydrolase protein [Mycena rebaudengoi]
MNPETTSPRPRARAVPMEVLVLGFCRTGTASMRAALAALGYGPAHHIGRLMVNPAEVDVWNAAFDAQLYSKGRPFGREEFDQLLGEFSVVADVPGILFAAELIDAYPEARVILTTRAPDRWWRSFRATLLVMLNTKQTRLARWLDPRGFGRFVPFARRNLEILLGPLDSITETHAKERYVAYNARIRALVPPELLIEYEMGEGWRRLCEFLGKDVPDVPFPHKNDAKMILDGSRKQIWRIYRRAVGKILALTSVLVAIAWAIWTRAL